MTEITGTAVAHEAYAFCCMRCGHGWEQAYDIEHHVDGTGQNFVVYKAGGVRVPSPLSSPSCGNCGGHVVRIMRSGQVSSVRALAMQRYEPARTTKAARSGKADGASEEAENSATVPAQGDGGEPADGVSGRTVHHHWHLSDLLHPFHHRR
ncbi:hypothetical protein [Streptomyces liangshanensis]|uniref:hypothetical protein n=1 Tax=Streptomyces liangshanensis TaxID=2717324 RepID=UPI0036DBF448